ncbi:MAG: nucleoside phosphorylase [Terracidiphilus sp.]|jgi:adenosylhomocysteine nucleosidase
MTRVAFIAAMRSELWPLVKGWRSVGRPDGTSVYETEVGEEGWIAVAGGMGIAGATRSFSIVNQGGKPDLIVNLGLAGSLVSDIDPPSLLTVGQIADTRTGERFNLASGDRKLLILTTGQVAGRAEKQRLAESYRGAVAVEMEAATVARLAQANGIPMACLKAISDAADDDIPDMNPFIDAEGRFQTGRYTLRIAVRPHRWRQMVRLGENSKRASRELARAAAQLLADWRNGMPVANVPE